MNDHFAAEFSNYQRRLSELPRGLSTTTTFFTDGRIVIRHHDDEVTRLEYEVDPAGRFKRLVQTELKLG